MYLDNGYAKFSSAAFALVTAEPLIKRLENAFLEFYTTTPEELSQEHYQRFLGILKRLVAVKAPDGAGDLRATLPTLSIEDQESIARDILLLAIEVNVEAESDEEEFD
jgi:hypothetical protein